jgi:molecular chaperone GrpE
MAPGKKDEQKRHSQKDTKDEPVFKEKDDSNHEEERADEKLEENGEGPVEAEVTGKVPDEEKDEAEALKKEIAETRDLIEQLRAENESLRDTAARAAADFYNYRKRVEREAQQTKQRIAARTAELLLPVLDNFDRALGSQDDGDASALRKGVEMVREQFFGVLQELGVETIEAEGNSFDPALHEAVAVEENSDAPDGTVVEEFQRGFLLGGRVLRASRVKVARRTDKPEETRKQEK